MSMEETVPKEELKETPAAQDENVVPVGRFNGVLQQLAELKKQNEQFAQMQAKIDADAKAAEERKAIEAQEFDSVLKARDAEKEALQKELEGIKRDSLLKGVENKLLSFGATDEIARDGLLARFGRENPEDIDAWIISQKEKYPKTFSASPTPVSSGPSGTVASGHPIGSLEARLKSPDKNIREAAISERFHMRVTNKI